MVSGTIQSQLGFYIGDLCYAMRDEIYHGFWGETQGYKDGVYLSVPGHEFGGFAVAGTAFGDGCYSDKEGNQYPVDAGIIGVMALELADPGMLKGLKDGDDCRIIYEGGSAEFLEDDGDFTIKVNECHSIHIDTRIE